MSAVADVVRQEQDEEVTPGLFQVWIDLNFGELPSDWWWNSPLQALPSALDEAAECRRSGWVAVVMPQGVNPRDDGRWDNP